MQQQVREFKTNRSRYHVALQSIAAKIRVGCVVRLTELNPDERGLQRYPGEYL